MRNETRLSDRTNAIHFEERRFITKKKDLVVVIQEPRPPLERMLRGVKWVQYLLPEQRVDGHHIQSTSTSYFNDRGVQTMSNVFIVLVCMTVLTGTMAVLNYIISNIQYKEVIIGVATVNLAGFLAWATDKKAFEVVTSMAT